MEIKYLALRRILRSVFRLLFKLLARVEGIGLENIPTEGGHILAINHLSILDPPLAFTLVERDKVTGLATDKYKYNLFLSMVIKIVNGIWINREEADFHALREARNYLRAGWLLGIAPEGTRSNTGALMRAKTGVAYLADKAKVPVIPVAISGTENAIRQLFRLHRPRLRIQFAKPFVLPLVKRQHRDQSLQRNTDEIMCRIAAMLPATYRGVYADHPRLQEILALQSETGELI